MPTIFTLVVKVGTVSDSVVAGFAVEFRTGFVAGFAAGFAATTIGAALIDGAATDSASAINGLAARYRSIGLSGLFFVGNTDNSTGAESDRRAAIVTGFETSGFKTSGFKTPGCTAIVSGWAITA